MTTQPTDAVQRARACVQAFLDMVNVIQRVQALPIPAILETAQHNCPIILAELDALAASLQSSEKAEAGGDAIHVFAREAVLTVMHEHNGWPQPHMASDELLELAEATARKAVEAYLGRLATTPNPSPPADIQGERQAIAQIIEPNGLFADDPTERHRAASPLTVEAAQSRVFVKADAILALVRPTTPVSTGSPE